MDVSAGGELLAQATLGDAATGVRATGVPGPSPGASPVTLDAGYGADPSGDVTAFRDSLERARASAAGPVSPVGEAVFERLDAVNVEARELLEYAERAIASGNELTPSEIVTLTAHSQEFMFHAQLTANVANRTAEGLQQLFRQQS